MYIIGANLSRLHDQASKSLLQGTHEIIRPPALDGFCQGHEPRAFGSAYSTRAGKPLGPTGRGHWRTGKAVGEASRRNAARVKD